MTARHSLIRQLGIALITGASVIPMGVLSATGGSAATALSSPPFKTTLAGPQVANMYSSGTEWDAVDGRIVVADTGNDHIEFYNPSTGNRTGQFGNFGSGNGGLNSPRDVAIDSAANIYVADAGNNRIEKFDKNGNFKWATPGTPISKCTSSTINGLCFNTPIGVTWDFTNKVLLVADTGNNLIKAITDNNGTTGPSIAWTSPPGTTIGVLNPRDVTRGPGGYLWVSAYLENQIKAFSVSSGGSWNTSPAVVLGDGTKNGHANNELLDPYNVAFSPDSTKAYVADIGNDRIAVYDVSKPTSPVWLGSYGKRCNQPCPSPVPSGEFAFLRRTAVESNGDVIGDDFWGNGMFVFPPATGAITTTVAPLLQIEGHHAGPDGFAQAFGITTGSDGTVYGVDRLNQRIERFTLSGGSWQYQNESGVRGVGFDAFSWPEDAAVAPDHSVWLADTRNGRLEHWPADLSTTSVTDVGSKGSTLGHFGYIEGIAVDSHGVVWAADTNNNRIQTYNPSNGTFTVYGKWGTGACGFNHPQGVAVGSNGAIYVADTLNNRIVEMQVQNGACSTFSAVFATGLSGPQGVTVAGDGTVWVADTGNNRIVHLSSTLADMGDGFGSSGTGNYGFNDPHSLAVYGNTLFVADTYNNRVQEYDISAS